MRIWSRLVLSLVALAVVGAYVTHWAVRSAIGGALAEETAMRAETQAEGLATPALAAAALAGDERAILPALMRAHANGASAAYLLGRDGAVIAHTDVRRRGQVPDEPLADKALQGRQVWEMAGSTLRLAYPLTTRGDAEQRLFGGPAAPVGALVLELPLDEQLRRAGRLSRRVLGAISLVALVLLVAASWSIARLLRFFERSVDTMLDGVIIVNGRGEISLINSKAVEMLDGGSAGRWVRRPLSEAFPACPDLVETLRHGFPVRDLELRVGGVDALCAANPFVLGDGTAGAVITLKDIGARKLIERLEAERERDMMQRDFVATVSHEFRTPVAAIKGFAETLLTGGLDDAENRREFVEIIAHHSDRLSRLVEDLLRLSVLESSESEDHRERVPLPDFCEALTRSVAPLVEHARVSLYVEVEPGLEAWADPAQLEQVLLNLLKNAVEYNRPGGVVRLQAARQGTHAHFTVVDTGMGIASDDLPKLFRRFHRSLEAKKRKAQGTGLGLLICRRIVERHGGLIWAESRHGAGSAFHVTIPSSGRSCEHETAAPSEVAEEAA